MNDNPKKQFQPVYSYRDLLSRRRQNCVVEGFDFDVDTFENLIDCFTPKENISVILGVSNHDLDNFCNIVYGMEFTEAYRTLISISDMFMRKAIQNLSVSGNPTALNLASKHMLKWEKDSQTQNVSIKIVNDLDKEGDN